jgi:hypothetical protein
LCQVADLPDAILLDLVATEFRTYPPYIYMNIAPRYLDQMGFGRACPYYQTMQLQEGTTRSSLFVDTMGHV